MTVAEKRERARVYAARYRAKMTPEQRAAQAEAQRRWYAKTGYKKKDPEVIRARNLKGSYGLTIEQYEDMAKDGCHICKRKECPSGRRLAVDHCHKTGVVRGIPCGPCNTALGKFQEDEQIMLAAIEYLRKA